MRETAWESLLTHVHGIWFVKLLQNSSKHVVLSVQCNNPESYYMKVRVFVLVYVKQWRITVALFGEYEHLYTNSQVFMGMKHIH